MTHSWLSHKGRGWQAYQPICSPVVPQKQQYIALWFSVGPGTWKMLGPVIILWDRGRSQALRQCLKKSKHVESRLLFCPSPQPLTLPLPEARRSQEFSSGYVAINHGERLARGQSALLVLVQLAHACLGGGSRLTGFYISHLWSGNWWSDVILRGRGWWLAILILLMSYCCFPPPPVENLKYCM